ncbi:MAG TPA: response regulator, partial [Chroococcidiopsis sp.]
RNVEGDLSQLSQGFPGIKSLIISPVASLRQVLTHDALGLHMHPTAVEHWQEALNGLQTGAIAPPDLVICHLPPTLSSDAASLSSLQREPSLAATRWLAVVSTTQLAMGQTLIGQSLMSQGFAAYVSQPIKPSRLKESVAIALGIGNDQRPLIGPISMTPGGLSDSDLPVDETKAALKILLVEDNVINQKLTLKQLTNLGYRADVVADGQEAVDAISQIAYDLVLMDCQMPVMDGYNATLAIRQLEEQRQANQQANQRPAVIIAMTANVLPEDRDRALAVGMNDYLPKPVSQETLAAVLVRWSHTILEGQAIAPSPAQNPADCPMSPDHLRQQMDLQMDWELLYQLSEGCAEFETELLQLFVDDSRVYLERLERAIGDRNFHQVEQAAHHIKGASANIGAKRLQAAADQLEQQSRQQQLLNAAELLTELKSSLNCIHWFVKTQTLPNQTRPEVG